MRLYKPRPTLNQLYSDNPSLFAGMVLPEGIDRSHLQGYILAECGSLDTIMGTATELAAYLPIWSAVHLDAWTRQAAALAADYNPIHNYDRLDSETELTAGAGRENAARTESRNRNSAASQDESGSIGRTESGSESETNSESGTSDKRGSSTSNSGFVGSTENSGEDTTTKGLQGFNSDTFQNSEQVVDEKGTRADSVSSTTNTAASEDGESSKRDSNSAKLHGSNTSEDSSRTSSAQEAQAEQSNGEESKEHSQQGSRTRSLQSSGNIGVTTTQQMIIAEVELRNRYTLYSAILYSFLHEICVGVY